MRSWLYFTMAIIQATGRDKNVCATQMHSLCWGGNRCELKVSAPKSKLKVVSELLQATDTHKNVCATPALV
jgi:hypothetical protein